MDHIRLDGGFQMPQMGGPALINQPPQIFGGYDGLPMQHLPPDMTAHMFGDPSTLLDEANEAKRRRIARVSTFLPAAGPTPVSLDAANRAPSTDRLVICVGRRRSSATASSQHALTASTTRQTASLPKSRRRGTRPRGAYGHCRKI